MAGSTKKASAPIEEFLKIKNMEVLLDTNILIQGTSEAHAVQRDSLITFCKQNKTYICDTVYFEFLRNTSIENFRKKNTAIKDWAGNLLPESSKVVGNVFEAFSLVYLEIHKKHPRKFLRLNINDRWIASAALAHDILSILTTDHSCDFPSEIFDDQEFNLGKNTVVHLKTLNVDRLSAYWQALAESEKIDLRFEYFHPNENI